MIKYVFGKLRPRFDEQTIMFELKEAADLKEEFLYFVVVVVVVVVSVQPSTKEMTFS